MTKQNSQGVISYSDDDSRKTDYLYRISLKCLVRNDKGEVLVVKETGRDWWDLPGGGMDHNENIKIAIAREIKEEINLDGDFSYQIIYVDEPAYLDVLNFWQVRLIFEVQPDNMSFGPGEDGDEVAFMSIDTFKNSERDVEQRIYKYAKLAS